MKQAAHNDRANYPVRKTTLAEQDLDPELENTTVEERLGMMWPLALDAWSFMGKPVDPSSPPRHMLRVRKYRR